jgi:hypothetical protein
MVANSATVTLASFRNQWAPSRQGNEITTVEKSLAASRDEAKHDRKSEQNHSLIESAPSSPGAGCRDQEISGTEPEERYFS